MALYKLAKAIGEDQFNRSVRTWITENSGPLVFKDLYTRIKQGYGLDRGLCNLFERVEDRVAL